MRSKVIGRLRLFGPFLIDQDVKAYKIHQHSIESQEGSVSAEKLTKKSNFSLRSLAMGEVRNTCVFFTPVTPNVHEVMEGLDKYIGWEGITELPINKVFDVNQGVVQPHDIELIKESFPEVFEDLQNHITTKKT